MPWLVETLPATLRAALIHGSEGAAHLASCARLAREAGLDRLAGELTLAAWSESPLDAALAAQASAVPGAPPATRELAAYVAANTAPPADLTYYQRLASRREADKIARYLAIQAEKEPGNLFWERLRLTHALDAGDFEAAAASALALPEPLGRLITGDAAMLRGDAASALANYARCPRMWACPGIEARLGLASLAAGDSDGAASWLRASVAREPWRVQALLALNDILWGARHLASLPDGPTGVLLYTFNKADDIDATLESLFASELGGAQVTVLDNGSTDETPAVLASWSGRIGPERMNVVTLPVNAGAPAARNWLIHLEAKRGTEWSAFLDDDVSLPPDWLSRLGAAAKLYPDAGAWGARVRDHARPARIQSADTFLVPLPDIGEGTRRFELTSGHHQTLDRGQFSYARPCATVTGCCHLFRTRTLTEQGGFDLRYSPSQYDDLDHDIRLLLAGKTLAYQGHLAVDHFKSTGASSGEGQTQYGLGFANQYKLHQKFTPEEFSRAAATADQGAFEDALAKWRASIGDQG